MEVAWTHEAIENLETAIEYLVEKSSPQVAEQQYRVITVAVLKLEQFPAMGRLGRLSGTRELVIPVTPYVAIYRVYADRVEIIALTHGAQLWPKEQ